MSLERGNWTDLKRRKRLLPVGRWKVQLRIWLERKADQRMELMRDRKRSMDIARGLTRARSIR